MRAKTLAAWAVHAYTALGAVFGFVALEAVFRNDFQQVFCFLALALAVDASDGALARAVRVRQEIPWIDGELLDNIVDYFTYVIVPAAIMVQPGVLPANVYYVALLVIPASAYGFCRTDAKGMIEHYFQGFPSYWNVMAFYFVVLGTSPMTNLLVLVVGLVMVFVPMRWLYPSRMEAMRTPTLVLGVVWALMGIMLIVQLPQPSQQLALLSLFYPVYYTLGSVLYHFRSDG